MAVCADCQRESPAGALYCAFCGAGLQPAGAAEAADALVGATLAGRYFLHALIGRGGMGDVYRATDLTLDRTVVVKVLRRDAAGDAGAVERFHREARAAARLSHPNSVALLDSGETEAGTLYMVMELVPGVTLAQRVATAWPLGEARVVEIGAQVLAALSEAHGLGIIHRDLKPANVMVERRDGADRVKVLDFGIATFTEGDAAARLTQHGTVFGTPAYMSPEQIRGEPLDPRSDLYSVGVILYELLAGRLPFEAPTPLGFAARHLTDSPPPLAEARPGLAATPALETLVRQALAKDPAGRPASAEAFRAALLACPVAAAPGPAEPAPLAPTAPLESAAVQRQVRVTSAPLPAAGPRPAAEARRRSRRALAWALAAVPAATLIASGAWRALVPSPVAPAAARVHGDAHPAAPASAPAPGTPAEVPPAPPAPRSTQAPARAGDAPVHAVVTVAAAELSPPPAPPGPPAARPTASAPERAPRPPAEAPPSPARTVISARRDELNSLPLPAADSGEGLLAIEASPWAQVSVDGQDLGETPQELQINAGKHRIRAVHPELGVKEGTAVVEAGKRKVWVAPLGK